MGDHERSMDNIGVQARIFKDFSQSAHEENDDVAIVDMGFR